MRLIQVPQVPYHVMAQRKPSRIGSSGEAVNDACHWLPVLREGEPSASSG